MEKNVVSMADVIDSIEVFDGTLIFYPRTKHRSYAEVVSDIIRSNKDRSYYMNGECLAFLENGHYYVAPYTKEGHKALEEAGFQQENFFVFFGNGEYPCNSFKWERLLREAKAS